MERRYITVGTLNRYLKNKFDTDPNIQKVYLKGEVSNFKGQPLVCPLKLDTSPFK